MTNVIPIQVAQENSRAAEAFTTYDMWRCVMGGLEWRVEDGWTFVRRVHGTVDG